jgi:hypothetical protein
MYQDLGDGTSDYPELNDVPFGERAKKFGSLWNEMGGGKKGEYEEMATREHHLKLKEWEGGVEAREEQRRKHCTKLGLSANSTSWEKIKRHYDNSGTSGDSGASSGGGASAGDSVEARQQKRQQERQRQQQHSRGGGGGSVFDSSNAQGKRRRVSGDALEDPLWCDSWEPVRKKEEEGGGNGGAGRLFARRRLRNRFLCFWSSALCGELGLPLRQRC